MGAYEYYLGFWGEIKNDGLAEQVFNTKATDFWFDTKQQRSAFKTGLKTIAKECRKTIAFREREGTHVRLKTVAKMIMVLPDGKEYLHEEDFGYAYPLEEAEYMFKEGNYACDCNRSLFLLKKYPEVEEMGCGDTIRLKDFTAIRA